MTITVALIFVYLKVMTAFCSLAHQPLVHWCLHGSGYIHCEFDNRLIEKNKKHR